MTPEIARAVLDNYDGRKLNGASARSIIVAWADAQGWAKDRWGNWHIKDGYRLKLTKQRVQRHKKTDGDWRSFRSTPIIEAANNLVKKAAEALGDDRVAAKIEGQRSSRRSQRDARAEKAQQELLQKEVMNMVTKVASAEMPVEFAELHDTGHASPEFQARYNELVRRVQSLRRLGRPPRDQDMFSSFGPPLAPLLIEGSVAQWVEEVRGVPYTITVRNADKDTAAIEIGSTAGEHSLGTRVDPVSGWISHEMGLDRVGDAYISGRVKRGKDGPYGALYFIISSKKQQGAGTRVLDLWCNLMDSYGALAWVAEAVGDEGMAFLEAKVRSGRLEMVGGRDQNYVMRCLGGPEGRQPMLPGVPLTPNDAGSGRHSWSADSALQEWRSMMAERGRAVALPPPGEPNPLYWLWEHYHMPAAGGWDFAPQYARNYATSQYALAVPSPEVIQRIARKGPLLEIGAGRGYWAKMLADAGADIIATDPYAPEHTFYPVERLSGRDAVERYGRGRTLLLVWPPYGISVAYDALRAFERVGGRSLIYVGEGHRGCTADDDFHAAIGEVGWDDNSAIENRGWKIVDVDYDLPNWMDVRDAVFFVERNGVSRNPADIIGFPKRPERVEIGSRTYALSDVGVPMKLADGEIQVDVDIEPDAEQGSDQEGPRIIDGGGNPFRYIWVHEPGADRFEMYRHSDGEWKVLADSRTYPETFRKLKRLGQLNVVTPSELQEFESEMRRRHDDTLSHLQDWWEESKGDEQRRIDELVRTFFDERVLPVAEKGWDDIERGVYPFDFAMNERIAEYAPRDEQGRMHVLYKAMEREGFNYYSDSALEQYVLQQLGHSSYEDLDDMQSIQWSVTDFLSDVAYPMAKQRRGRGRRGFEPA